MTRLSPTHIKMKLKKTTVEYLKTIWHLVDTLQTPFHLISLACLVECITVSVL